MRLFRPGSVDEFDNIMDALTRGEIKRAWRSVWGGGYFCKEGLYFRRYDANNKCRAEWFPSEDDRGAGDWEVST